MVLTLVAAALVVGVLRMTNSWDFPTYLALIGAAVFLAEAVRPGRDWPSVLARTVVLGLGVTALSHLLIAPYLQHNALFYSGFERAPFRTTAPHYLVIMGAFLAVLAAYLAFQLLALRRRLALGALGAWAAASGMSPKLVDEAVAPSPLRIGGSQGLDRVAGAFGLGVAFLAVLLLLAGLPVVGIAGAGVGALAVVAVLRRPPRSTLFAFLLAATALGITSFVEIVTLKGDIGRMNTVFKFYIQAWLLLSIACSVLLALMARRAWSSRRLVAGWRRLLALSLAAVLAMTLIYPLLGTPSKLQHRFQVSLPPTLDGMAYMSQARYEDNGRDLRLPDDFAAINWMLDNIQGTPVIVEGLAPLYHWRSRVSIYTGLPTVLGWDWHQKQQRGDFAYMVDERARDVEAIYSTREPEAARALLGKYRVEYIYVGGQERAFYPPEGLEKFERMVEAGLERVYRNPTVTIYRITRG